MRLNFLGIFIDKITGIMLIILPSIILMGISLMMVLLLLIKPGFRFHWLLASFGAILSVIAILLWKAKLPFTFSFPAWKPETIFLYSPSWMADGVSWPFALSLATLGFATITTAVVRKLTTAWNWAGILFLVSIGILTVSGNNPLTIVIAWFAIDITELAILLSTVKEEKSEEIVISFSIRLAGIFLLLWASIVSIANGSPLSFSEIPVKAVIILLLAGLLRFGIIPLHLPILDLDQKRGLLSTLRLISAASGLSLIARIPSSAFSNQLIPYLIIIFGLITLFSSWKWLKSADELAGRPYLISGFGFLAITAMLLGNSQGSLAWGVGLILSGGVLFLYSSRGRSTYWIMILSLLGISSLPFSLTSNVWLNYNDLTNLLLIPHYFGYSILLAGYFRHAFTHKEDFDIRLEPRWVQVIYPFGLSSLPLIGITIGFLDWLKIRSIGTWWINTISLILSLFIYILFIKILNPSKLLKLRYQPVNLGLYSSAFWAIYHFIRKFISLLTSILEGDGGILWSIVIIVLFISIISQVLQFVK